MNSCLYVGSVRHRRFGARPNRFRYRVFMAFIDLAELPSLFDRFWLWSARRPAPAWFRRADFHGDPQKALETCVRDLIAERTGHRPSGPIRLLTHLRYFGHNFNPVSFYYVYDARGALEYLVAEITNTPWKERHAYVLRASDGATLGVPQKAETFRWQFDKTFHVSPFLPMEMRYDWRLSAPNENLYVHMETCDAQGVQLDATLALQRRPLDSRHLASALLTFPFVTVKVIALIYLQALKLYVRRTPVFAHSKGFAR